MSSCESMSDTVQSLSKVHAVVISYRPDLPALLALVGALRDQIGFTYIIDNGSDAHDLALLRQNMDCERVELVELGRNTGVATAQNRGIAKAVAAGAQFVLLFDQDSLPESDMVSRLLACVVQQRSIGVKVAAVGPRYTDERQDNPPPFIRVRNGRLLRHRCESSSDIVEVDYLVSSGCLIPVEALKAVGPMREELFIDYIDIEWGLRATDAGWRCFGCCGARMMHRLGDEPIRRFGQEFPARSPLRHYYMMRNAVWLYIHSSLRLDWKLADGLRFPLRFGFYALFATPRSTHLRMMLRGIWHGLRGRLGPYPD